MYWPDGIEGDWGFYWSSSPLEDSPLEESDYDAWVIAFYSGALGPGGENTIVHVRCLR